MSVTQGQGIDEILDQLHAHIHAGSRPIKLISFAFKISAVDPLDILQTLHLADHYSHRSLSDPATPPPPWTHSPNPAAGEQIYWEVQRHQTAIAAIGQVTKTEFNGPHRFRQAQDFITDYFLQTLCVGETERPYAKPQFFCGFTFAEQKLIHADECSPISKHSPQPPLAFTPFPAASLVLPHWQVVRHQGQSTLVVNLPWAFSESVLTEINAYIASLCQQAWKTYEDVEHQLLGFIAQNLTALTITRENLRFRSLQQQEQNWVAPQCLTPSSGEAEKFRQGVQTTLQAIQQENLQKAVLACAFDVQSSSEFSVPASIRKLRDAYPNCYLFALGNGCNQTFLGASPERLLSIHNHHLETDALAGTAPRGQTPAADLQLAHTLRSSPKERHEHQLVVEFILHQLQQLGLRPHSPSSPNLLKLSTLQHLHTLIQAEGPFEVHPLEILAQLHPTPAVAGVPRQAACEHIRHHEGFERSLYAAPIGWIDQQHNCEFIVGIRSALLNGSHVRLYAGAGIVKGSEPERELAEVQLKLQSLLTELA